MHRSAILSTVATLMIVPGANAQSRASFSACEALSEQRGSAGIPGSTQAHIQFMRDCLAGRIPFAETRTPAPTPVAQTQRFEMCEAFAVQQGAGPESHTKNHRSFVRECITGGPFRVFRVE
jgi:hypothetical protein